MNNKKSATAKLILSGIMLALGGMICLVSVLMLLLVFVMPNSIAAYYMIESGFFFNPVVLLVIGVVLIVVGLALNASTRRSRKKSR